MSKVYLSIDLDFWAHSQRQHCNAFFEKVFALRLPIFAVCEHHHLLPTMAGCFDVLYNVDWHSDLCDPPEEGWIKSQLNEGTWGNYVPWRKQGTFIWRYPRPCCLHIGTGYCHSDVNPFEKPVSGWKHTQKHQGTAGIPWDDIKAVGVCLSPAWIGREAIIHEPIVRLGMQDWLDLDGFDLIPPLVRTIPPPVEKRTNYSLANLR